jgi:dolichol-phosphate mannosyltransferase
VIKGKDKDVEHTCDPGVKETVALIIKESKPCPKCGERISKIDGCDQMWCIDCHTAFSWATGQLVNGVVHNPHYYEFLRQQGNGVAPRNAGDFRLLSRPALDALNSMNEGSLYLRGLVGWIGFPSTSVFYKRPERQAGTTKFPLIKMLRFASDSIASFSTAPLKMSYALAISLFLVLMIYGMYSAFAVLFLGHSLEAGWLSLIASVTIIGCANLLCLGVIGEYVGRIYMEGKKRPIFLVAETKNME